MPTLLRIFGILRLFSPAKLLLFSDIFMVLFGPFLFASLVMLHFCCTFAVFFEQVSKQNAKSTNDSCSCSVVLGKPVNTNKKGPCNARTLAHFVLRYLHDLKFPRFQSRVEQIANALIQYVFAWVNRPNLVDTNLCGAKVLLFSDICK